MRRIAPLAALALLAGCAGVPGWPTPAGVCRAGPAQFAVGRIYDYALGQRARAAAKALALRVVPHDGVTTMEFSGDRLTLRLDASQRVTSATCG